MRHDSARMRDPYECEYPTVGSLLLAPRLVPKVAGWLTPEDFEKPFAGEVYGLVLAMHTRGEPIDPVTMRGELARGFGPERAKQRALDMFSMVESVPAPAMVWYYARQVLEGSVRRRMEQVGTRVIQMSQSRGDTSDLIGSVREEFGRLAEIRRRWDRANLTDRPGNASVDRSEPPSREKATPELREAATR